MKAMPVAIGLNCKMNAPNVSLKEYWLSYGTLKFHDEPARHGRHEDVSKNNTSPWIMQKHIRIEKARPEGLGCLIIMVPSLPLRFNTGPRRLSLT